MAFQVRIDDPENAPAPTALVLFDFDGVLSCYRKPNSARRCPGCFSDLLGLPPDSAELSEALARMFELIRARGDRVAIVSNAGARKGTGLADVMEFAARHHLDAAVGCERGFYTKPFTGLWDELVRRYDTSGLKVVAFCGDAAGRAHPAKQNRAGVSVRSRDHSADDLNFAANVESLRGIPVAFMTPEEVMGRVGARAALCMGESQSPAPRPAWARGELAHAAGVAAAADRVRAALADAALADAALADAALADAARGVVVIMVGPQGIGKTSAALEISAALGGGPANVFSNDDAGCAGGAVRLAHASLAHAEKAHAEKAHAEKAHEGGVRFAIVDNTNPSADLRRQAAGEWPHVAVHVTTGDRDLDDRLSRHSSAARTQRQGSAGEKNRAVKYIPSMAFSAYWRNFCPPAGAVAVAPLAPSGPEFALGRYK